MKIPCEKCFKLYRADEHDVCPNCKGHGVPMTTEDVVRAHCYANQVRLVSLDFLLELFGEAGLIVCGDDGLTVTVWRPDTGEKK